MPDTNAGYTKIVRYEFSTSQYVWSVVEVDDGRMTFEAVSVRRTIIGNVVRGGAGGRWMLDKATRGRIGAICFPGTADEVEAFFNEHGPPKE